MERSNDGRMGFIFAVSKVSTDQEITVTVSETRISAAIVVKIVVPVGGRPDVVT